MPKIGATEIAAAYALSRDVSDGKLTDLQAAEKLQDLYGMNFSSASGYLRKRRQMPNGERYTRTMNIAATRYYLDKIYEDEGASGLKSAISSVRRHAQYYKEQGKSGLPSIMACVNDVEKMYLSDGTGNSDVEWQRKVGESYKLSDKQRRKQLPSKGHKPEKKQTITTVYLRSPHVVAERLKIANGICEECNEPAPFVRKIGGLPYLEVHQRVTLANDGDDTVENTIALCPNCHRRAHHG